MLSSSLALALLFLTAEAAPVSIDLVGSAAAGDPGAPVTVVEYACARCPFCARLTPELYDAVTTGVLKGKAKLYLRVFPIKSHPGAKEAAMAFEAAGALGSFWPYVLLAFRHYSEFDVEKRTAWAQEVGLDPQAFAPRLVDPTLVDRLVASKKEGLANGVDGTPTVFINAVKYVGKHDLAGIVAAVDAVLKAPASR